MKAIVCGGRDFVMTDHYAARFHSDVGRLGITMIIHGAARGADSEAAKLAKGRGLPTKGYRADWAQNGKAAGSMRNQHMLNVENPDYVIAFPGGKGTADMIRRAEKAGVKVINYAS